MRPLLFIVCCAFFMACHPKDDTTVVVTPKDPTAIADPPPLPPPPIVHFTPHVDTFYGTWVQEKDFPWGTDTGTMYLYINYYEADKLRIGPFSNPDFYFPQNNDVATNDSNTYYLYQALYVTKHVSYHFEIKGDSIFCKMDHSAYDCSDPPLNGVYTGYKVNHH